MKNKLPSNHLVQAITRRSTRQGFKFKSGSRYIALSSGAIVRAEPKQYTNKAGMKRYKKERRAAREAAA